MPLYIAFIDLTKECDLVSRDGLFKVIPKIGCPPKLQIMTDPFHTDTNGTVQFNGSSSEPFKIRSGVKQGCFLAPKLFWDCIWPVAKTCIRRNRGNLHTSVPVSELIQRYSRFSSGTSVLFVDEAAVITHTQEELQSLMDCFSQACKDFGLTISLRKTNYEGTFNSRPSHGSSVEKPQAVREDKDGSLQCLCYQHIAVWQREMDYICQYPGMTK